MRRDERLTSVSGDWSVSYTNLISRLKRKASFENSESSLGRRAESGDRVLVIKSSFGCFATMAMKWEISIPLCGTPKKTKAFTDSSIFLSSSLPSSPNRTSALFSTMPPKLWAKKNKDLAGARDRRNSVRLAMNDRAISSRSWKERLLKSLVS